MDNDKENPDIAAAVATVENELISTRQAAELKGVTVDAIYKAIERGHLASQKVLGRIVLSSSEVAAWTPGSYTTQEGKREGVVKPRGRSGGRPAGQKEGAS